MILNPPFEQFQFGRMKEYSLIKGEFDHTQKNFVENDEMNQLIKNTFGNAVVIQVGKWDEVNGFYIGADDLDGPIYSLNSRNSIQKLTQVADNIDALYKICSEIAKFWSEYKGKRSLPKTPETVAKMKEIMADFQQYSPNSFSLFWQEYAMGELMIGLEL